MAAHLQVVRVLVSKRLLQLLEGIHRLYVAEAALAVEIPLRRFYTKFSAPAQAPNLYLKHALACSSFAWQKHGSTIDPSPCHVASKRSAVHLYLAVHTVGKGGAWQHKPQNEMTPDVNYNK